MKERESEGLYCGHNLKFGSWGGLRRGATFLRGFSYITRFPGTEPSCYRRANCIVYKKLFYVTNPHDPSTGKIVGGEVTPVEERVASTGALSPDVTDCAPSHTPIPAPTATHTLTHDGEKITHIDHVLMDEVSKIYY